MSYVRVTGFQIYTDHNGHPRCYHRATRTPIDLKKYPLGSAGFLAECSKLTNSQSVLKPGTLGLLINAYRAHSDFQDLKPRTRADYQRCMDYLKPIQDTPLSSFRPTLIVRIRDKAGEELGRKWGTYVKTTLSLLFSWGKERGFVETNPAFKVRGIKKPKDAP